MKPTLRIICLSFLFIAAKPSGVVINPLGPSSNAIAPIDQSDDALKAATAVKAFLDKKSLLVTLTRKGTYPLSYEDRIGTMNALSKQIVLSLSVVETHQDVPFISLFQLAPLPSTRTEGLFIYPIEKAHTPWVKRSSEFMKLYAQMFPPGVIAKQTVSSVALWPLYGINHPALWAQWHIPVSLPDDEKKALLQDWAQRTGLVLQTHLRKEY